MTRKALVTICVYMPRGLELGKQGFQLAIAHQRIAANQRDVQGLVLVDERENSAHQFVTFEVGELAKLHARAEVRGVEGVAAGTAQGAFLGDFDG